MDGNGRIGRFLTERHVRGRICCAQTLLVARIRVLIARNGFRATIVMAFYERQRKRAWENALKVMDETADYAASQGLTESCLEHLLADES